MNAPLHKDIPHPAELIGSRAIIQGASGAGKTYAIRRILEATHGRMQHLVFDVEDELFTLRERFDYVLIGGDEADAPISEATAGELALTLLELGVSAILQLNDFGLAGHAPRRDHPHGHQRAHLRRCHGRPHATGHPGRADRLHGRQCKAQAEATKAAQRAGIEQARADQSKYRGRKPSFDREQLGTVRDLLSQGAGPAAIAKIAGISRQAIYRIEADPAAAEGMLASWGM